MSHWFFRQFIQNQIFQNKEKKFRAGDMFLSILMVCLGGLLLLSSLGFGETFSRDQDRAMINKRNFSPGVVYWEEQIEEWAETYNLDPILIATVMQIESCGDPQALSPANAHGLFQVMPYHFDPTENMLDPQINAQRGLTYLSESFEKANGDIERTLAGYNGGHGQITRAANKWPEETRHYVYWGLRIYQETVSGRNQGETLEDWLAAGGWRLCQQAEKNLGLE